MPEKHLHKSFDRATDMILCGLLSLAFNCTLCCISWVIKSQRLKIEGILAYLKLQQILMLNLHSILQSHNYFGSLLLVPNDSKDDLLRVLRRVSSSGVPPKLSLRWSLLSLTLRTVCRLLLRLFPSTGLASLSSSIWTKQSSSSIREESLQRSYPDSLDSHHSRLPEHIQLSLPE